ncbi:hypothetical protein L226DRAFT_110240 [Lentinus tigrinus ALCF2SS1-7]|uniref:uncharacterized protein n=1 Tax=Lentinus tigrinus ALCF2SS1-7 TaxID=1328758 RepID=UPI0011660EFD|nr:hypothetical protein L226DRAFT_110240 [Lentinus tigrinus ALCF2SS1-7]
MASRKVKASDRYNVQRGVQPFQEMMADSASTWLQEAQNAPAQHAEGSHPHPSTTTGAVMPVGSSLVHERATYTFHNYNAAPDGSGPMSAAYSTSSVPMPGAVSAQYGNSLYPGTHGGRSQYNATFPPLPPPPSAAFLPSDPSAIPPLWPPASSPAPPTSALPSPTTSRRSQSAVPHPAAAQSSREPSWSARFADDGQAYEHGLERLANGTSSTPSPTPEHLVLGSSFRTRELNSKGR